MENEIYYSKGYTDLKNEIKEELSKSVNSFVRIGYLLKVARDTNILAESQYSNMEEFAYAEFKIDKGTASKFMAINDRFSEGGNSDHLKPEYNGIGWSKLSIMLQLPDAANEELSDDYSKSEMATLREEFAEAEKETPLETMMEGETDTTAAVEDILCKAIRQMGESEPQLYVAIHAVVSEDYTYNLNDIKSIMAPAGEMIYSIRIRGLGRYMLSMKDFEETVALINERTGEKTTRLWDDVARAWLQIVDVNREPVSKWEEIYGQQFPKEEVAPVQPQKETKVKKVNDKPSKRNDLPENVSKLEKTVPNENETVQEANEQQETLHDISEEIPVPDPKPQEVIEETVSKEPETEIPGQDNITEHSEWMPQEQENAVNTKDDNVMRGYRAAVTNKLNRLQIIWNGDNEKKASLMLDILEDLKWNLTMLEMEEE